jgi:hypothetical protein
MHEYAKLLEQAGRHDEMLHWLRMAAGLGYARARKRLARLETTSGPSL